MKTKKIRQFLTLAVAFTFLLTLQSGCSYGFGIKGNGKVTKQERQLNSFSALDVGGAFKVFLTQGDKEFVIVEADENLLDVISTEVRGNTLVIKTTKDIRDSEVLNIYLTFKELDEMEISGACRLVGENKMKFGNLDLECSGASDVELKLAAQKLSFDFSGACKVELYGSAESVDLDLSGASHFDGYDLEADIYNVDVSGASHAKIFVNSELSADVSGAASLKYKGEPTIKHHDVSGAASMKKY